MRGVYLLLDVCLNLLDEVLQVLVPERGELESLREEVRDPRPVLLENRAGDRDRGAG